MNDVVTGRRRETTTARLEKADPHDVEIARLHAEIAWLRKDYGKEVVPLIANVLLMGRGVHDTPREMANALIKRLKFEGYEIRKIS